MLPEPILVEWELTYLGHARPPFGIPEAEVRRPPLVRGFDDYMPLRQRGGASFYPPGQQNPFIHCAFHIFQRLLLRHTRKNFQDMQ